MKKIFFILIGLIIFIFAAAAWYVHNNKESILATLNSTVQAETGQPLILKTLPSLSLIPLGLNISEASWGTKDAPVSMQIKDLTVAIRFVDIIQGKLQISLVDIQNFTLAINETASKTTKKLQGQSKTPQESVSLEDIIASSATRISALPVEELRVHDASITMFAKDKPLATIKGLTLDFKKTGIAQATIQNKAVTWPKIALSINAKNLSYGMWQGEALAVHLRGEAGQYTFDRYNFKMYGGTSSNQIDIDLRKLTPTIRLTSNNDDINLALIPKEITPFPMKGTIAKTVTLATHGKDKQAFYKNLEGEVNLLGKNIIVRFNNNFIPMLESNFPEAKAKIVFKKGIGTFENTQFQGEAIHATTKGTINVPKENVDILMQIELIGINLPFFIRGPFASLYYGFEEPKIIEKDIPAELLKKPLKESFKRLDSLIKKL